MALLKSGLVDYIISKCWFYFISNNSRLYIRNSKKVFKFSGEGAVINTLLNPNLIAAAAAIPIAADLPLKYI